MEELWASVVGFEGLYRVSNHGKVMSCARVVPDGRTPTGTRTKQDKLLKLTVDSAGYQKVKLYRGTDYEVWKVHRLVATHFCTKPEGCDIINHIDNVKTNNVATNLEWTTSLGNNQHMVAQGRQRPQRGEDSGTAKIAAVDVKIIRQLCAEGVAQTVVGQTFGISQTQVSRIVRGERWAHI